MSVFTRVTVVISVVLLATMWYAASYIPANAVATDPQLYTRLLTSDFTAGAVVKNPVLHGNLPAGTRRNRTIPGTPLTCGAVGRGHRLWFRAGAVPRDGGSGALDDMVRSGTRRLLAAFGSDIYNDGTTTPNATSDFFASVGRGDVLVTDPCGRVVASGDAARIDVVFTHVDAEAQGWAKKMKEKLKELLPGQGLEMRRYRNNGELKYATRSVLRHAAHMVRRIIFLVDHEKHVKRTLTKNMQEAAAEAGIELVVVKHADVFPDASVLPTYNSHSIEAVLHRIPGLSPFLLYFNDDFMLGRRMSWFDLVRPLLVESEGVRPTAHSVGDGRLVRIGDPDTIPGQFAASAMTRPGDGAQQGSTTVWVEAEVIPYLGYDLLTPLREHGFNVTASREVDPATINPEVADACGPREYVMRHAEIKDREKGSKTYNSWAAIRRTRAIAWNYLGVNAMYTEAQKAHFVDRAHMEQMMDGDKWTGAPPLIPQQLTDFTRASQFRRTEDAKMVWLAVYASVADNWRRRKELLARYYGDRQALDQVLQCTSCPTSTEETDPSCVSFGPEDVISMGVELMTNDTVTAITTTKRGATATRQLLRPLVPLSNSHHDYYSGNACKQEELHKFAGELWKRPRLWISINDCFPSDDVSLPDGVQSNFRKVFRIGSAEPGCVKIE